MARGKSISSILKPLGECETQCYLGTGLHSLGLLIWILSQTGSAEVYMSTFSTSEEFLCGFLRLRKKGLVQSASCLADLKASRKTVKLQRLFNACFDHVYLGMNHSKLTLVKTDTLCVTVITSQNQTYGDRVESTMVTTSKEVFDTMILQMQEIIKHNSYENNSLFPRNEGPGA